MEIVARVESSPNGHTVEVRTGPNARAIEIPAKGDGRGSAVNGGELLMLALATCYCNDLYRGAARLGIPLDGATVEASAVFPGVGLAATDIRYRATLQSAADGSTLERLLRETDAVAEVHNTVRSGVPVVLVHDGPAPHPS
ncbi:MAG: OsmC family protein [Armatimonadota bacterium]